MTSWGNDDSTMQPSIAVGTEEQEDDFLLTMKTFDFAIVNDDPELDLPSQVTNPPNIITASSDVQLPILRPSAQQPTVETLQSLGIKVRDFAYESTLPPIAPIPRVPRQTQPSARPLKRTRGDWEEENGESSRSSRPQFGREATNASSSKPESLVRTATEPLEFNPPPVSKRAMGCAVLSRPVLFGSQLPFRTPRRALKAHRTPPRMSSTTPQTSPLFGPPSEEPSQEASQESELVMTPAGPEAWHIEDTSSIPASQLDRETSVFVPEEICYSQLGLSPQSSQLSTSIPTPMRPPIAPSHVLPPLQAVDPFESSHLIPQIPNSRRGPKVGMKGSTTKVSTQTSPRYLLRRRSLLSVHAPTRSRYPHPLTPTKKGSPKGSPQPRCRRLQRPVLSR